MYSTTTIERPVVERVIPPYTEPRSASFPADWPQDGPIDLAIHDRPHGSATKEWWYLNAHLSTADGRRLALFASFFRYVVDHGPQTGAPIHGHFMVWALSDLQRERYLRTSVLDRSAPQIALRYLNRADSAYDPHVRQAMREVFAHGSVPLPDRLFASDVQVAADRLALDFEGNRLTRCDDGSYRLELVSPEHDLACDVRFTLQKPVVRHGDGGVVRGTTNDDMFYYFGPRCHVAGTITANGAAQSVAGSGWYDHEFGGRLGAVGEPHLQGGVAWNWVSAQLDNGCELTAYNLFDMKRDREPCGHVAVVVDPDGQVKRYDTFVFVPLDSWISTRTFNSYPTRWRLAIPDAAIELDVEASFGAQECITIIAPPAFWEGRVHVSGTFGGRPVAGPGFVERCGFDEGPSLKSFLGAASRQTQRAVADLLPLDPTAAQARRLLSGPSSDHLDGVDLPLVSDVLIRPIRDIIDRGGKSWRSYALLASIDAVGGDSQPFLSWLAVPELLHVGSLIVDDVEDRSTVRRGGPACHVVYGEPLAINAGSAAYFLVQPLIHEVQLPADTRVRIYDVYFEALRAAHAGQALDIAGLGHLMPEVVQHGDATLLEQRLVTIHRFKAGVPARALARMGAHLGGGTSTQIEALSHFFEQLGIAFQIVDDVLNLRGFAGELKNRGEDLTHGKVTMPVAKAMGRLPHAERQALWETINGHPMDPAVVAGLIEQLEACGAVKACVVQAEQLVEAAWGRLDQCIPDSFPKLMLRAFSWYVLARVY